MRTQSDIELMEKLMSWGIDEIRAAALIGEMDCPTCKSRLDPLAVTDMHTRLERIFVGYTCSECNEGWIYDVKKRIWEARCLKKESLESFFLKRNPKKHRPRF